MLVAARPAMAQGTDSSQTGNPNQNLQLNNPQNITTHVEYDPLTNQYVVTRMMGDFPLGPPTYMTPAEYQNFVYSQQDNQYWNNKSNASTGRNSNDPGANSILPAINIGGEQFDRVFGGNAVEIIPRGSAELIFSAMFQKTENFNLPERNRKTATFNFDEKIQMNVTGKIGNKLQMNMNYDTEATFNFENQMKLEYNGEEDDIIRKLEMGNVSLPLNSTLIQGAQSLFGVKGQFQFGKATITTVISEQQSESTNINVEGGASTMNFEFLADNYEANRHFFLAQYFIDNFDEALRDLPVIRSPVIITKVEVWVTNRNNQTQNVRNIIGFMDLGEAEVNNNVITVFPGPVLPRNDMNSLFPTTFANDQVRDYTLANQYLNGIGFREGLDYADLQNARLLLPSEYTINLQLGYISLNQALNQDEILAVAFQYTINGETYQVGEFSTDGVDPPKNLMLKLLKSNITFVQYPIWDLMMKNIYSIGAYQVQADQFRLDVLYANDQTGTPMNFIPEGSLSSRILLRVMNLDRLNNNNDPQPDGVFDFVPGLTITPNNGRIIFPVVEPFGSHLAAQFAPGEEELVEKYVFQTLYDSTRFVAQQDTKHNKFLLRGTYRSSSGSEIPLNAMNIPQGSVKVSAGGRTLVENVHYTVDYNLGRVTIIDEGLLNSQTPIQISLENNSAFSVQNKRFLGFNLDYKFNNDLVLGASLLNLTERPLTQKVNVGDEPINNTIWGINGNYNKESRWLTRMVDRIPLINTKAPSSFNLSGEFAHLIPGSPKGIEIQGAGTSYIDDFENTQTVIDLRTVPSWFLASTPQNQLDVFPEGELTNDQAYGFNRARLAWYIVDPLFHQNNSLTPDHIKNDPDQQSNHYVREVLINELFPNKDIPQGQPQNMAVLNLAYYPAERGPYNYDVEPTPYSAGLEQDGSLAAPSTRWAGVMREIQTSNFETANIEFLQMWILDPFIYNPNHQGGDLYFNLGSISEDILRDNMKSYENGLPTTAVLKDVDTTAWGQIPNKQSLLYAFDNDPNARPFQDLGLDGMNDEAERTFPYNGDTTQPSYLERIQNYFGSTTVPAYVQGFDDPSSDNYHYYRGQDYDADQVTIWDRYKYYNNHQGNSPIGSNTDPYPTAATNMPDVEDVNRDQTMNKLEAYYQYRISIRRQDWVVGQNYITDSITAPVRLQNGTVEQVTWYQFKIPLFEPDKVVGGITDFRSIRFMRMFMKGFNEEIILRFGRLEFVRGDWRRYLGSLEGPQENLDDDNLNETVFDVFAVNLEENGLRTPIRYTIPPGIDRQIILGTTNLQAQNEQSLAVRVCNLKDGDARAVFKNMSLDMRLYKRIRMFVHAEAFGDETALQDGDITAFMRLGSDFTENYYEYEIPLKVTKWGEGNPDLIWPSSNEFNFYFEELHDVKLERNKAMESGTDVTYASLYTVDKGSHKITVVGNPSTGNVRTIMIGVRNPKKRGFLTDDDGLPKCAELWFNELRLTDFDERGGWAATARAVTKLADLGTVSLSGTITTVGYGSLEKKVQERNTEETKLWDLATNFELGKFLGDNSGIRIPMYFGIAEEIRDPRFNPLDPDIELKGTLDNFETREERDSLNRIVQDYTKRRSLNFTNVRKERRMGGPGGGPGAPGAPGAPGRPGEPGAPGGGGGGGAKIHLWDIENFAVTYSLNEIYYRNVTTQYRSTKNQRGQLAYNYNNMPKNIRPFANVGFLRKSNWFAIIRDANFYLLPSRLAFRFDLERRYSEELLRNNTDALMIIEPNFNKAFTFNRIYDLQWDLTRTLKIDYTATSNNRVDEPEGAITDSARAVIWDNLKNGGRTTGFHHTLNVNWQVPINKIPLLDWTTASVRYTANYDWTAASLVAPEFGNIAQNSNTVQLNAQGNLIQLYNKSPYLKRLNTPKRPARPDDEEEPTKINVFNEFVKLLMMTKNVNLTYNETNGTMLPGFMPGADYFGMSKYQGLQWAPTLGFVFGSQEDIRVLAAERGWITQDSALNNQFVQTQNRTLNARATLEPIKDFRIELTANRQYSYRYSTLYRYDEATQDFVNLSPIETGNFNMSFLTWATAFEPRPRSETDYFSEAYEQFLANRQVIANRIALDRFGTITDSDGDGYPDGYGPTSREVLVPAFLAAYSGSDANNYTTSFFHKIPLPNWRINYDGLMKMKWFKNNFRNVTLSHSYRSTYTIGNYQTDLRFEDVDGDGFPDGFDDSNNYITEYQLSNVTISEQFAPLLKVDATLLNSFTARVEFKKDRNLGLSFANNQITEIRGQEYVFGLGYRFKDVTFRVKSAGRSKKIVSDLNALADVSIRDNVTINRNITDLVNDPTAGQRLITIKVTGDYIISQRFSVRVFYDRIVTKYEVSNTFPTANTNIGVSMRFSLGM